MKKVIAWILLIVVVLGLGAGAFMFLKDRNIIDVPNKDEKPEVVVAMGDGKRINTTDVYALPQEITFDESAFEGNEELKVLIQVENDLEKYEGETFTWTKSWAHASSEDTNDYIVVKTYDGEKFIAELTCKKTFLGKMYLSFKIGDSKAYLVTIWCSNSTQKLDVQFSGINSAEAGCGKYYELEEGKTYEFYLTPKNVYGEPTHQMNFDCGIVGNGKIIIKDNVVNTETEEVTWTEGTEQTISLFSIKKVSPWIEEMFTIEEEGNKITVTVNATPEKYIAAQSAVSDAEISCEDTFYAFENDNWYYSMIFYELNSQVTTTFRVRPVASVA